MKRALLVLAAFTMIFALSSCSSDETQEPKTVTNPTQPTPKKNTEEVVGPEWKLKISSTCGDATQQCRGYYGLSVLPDGTYQIGPSPDGQLLTGKITDEEFKQLQSIVSDITAANALADSDSHVTLDEAVSESKDVITLTRHTNEQQLIQAEGTDLSTRIQPDIAKTLYSAMRNLTNSLYITPFPGACTAAIIELEKLYAPLRQCSADTDCAYVDVNFFPIKNGTRQRVDVDTCDAIMPLPVANSSKLLADSFWRSLQVERTAAQTKCQEEQVQRLSCTPLTFQSDLANPVCNEGVCKINSAITF